jgi:hypothetical protein
MFIIKPTDLQIPLPEELISIPKYEQLKAALNGGMLEVVPHLNKFMGRNCVAFCDEEGKLNGLPSNFLAQKIWEESFGRAIIEDHLVGPIVIIVGSPSFLREL